MNNNFEIYIIYYLLLFVYFNLNCGANFTFQRCISCICYNLDFSTAQENHFLITRSSSFDRSPKDWFRGATQIPLASNYAQGFRDSRVDHDIGRRVRVRCPMSAASARTQRVGYNPETAVFRMHAFGISVNGAARGMPNGIANPIQETSGTNGGSMFYRYCSRRSTDVRLESAVRILRVLSAVCKRIYGLAFVYRRPCYHFPHRRFVLFLTRTVRRRRRKALK